MRWSLSALLDAALCYAAYAFSPLFYDYYFQQLFFTPLDAATLHFRYMLIYAADAADSDADAAILFSDFDAALRFATLFYDVERLHVRFTRDFFAAAIDAAYAAATARA